MSKRDKAPKETFTVAVHFAHDEHLMLIPNATDYGGYNANLAYVEANAHKIFFNFDRLLYIGRADLGDLPLQKEGNEYESR